MGCRGVNEVGRRGREQGGRNVKVGGGAVSRKVAEWKEERGKIHHC